MAVINNFLIRISILFTLLIISSIHSYGQSEYYNCKVVFDEDTSAFLVKHNFLKRHYPLNLLKSGSKEQVKKRLASVNAILIGDDRYIVRNVAIPKNSENFSKLDNTLVHELVDSTLLLKTIYQGSKSLYEASFQNKALFYIGDENKLALLVYKRYREEKVGSSTKIGSNSTYINQLLAYLNLSGDLTQTEIDRLRYTGKSISSLFDKYYESSNELGQFVASRKITKNSYLVAKYSRMSTRHDLSLENQFQYPSIGYAIEFMGRIPRNHSFYNEVTIGYGDIRVERSSVSGFNRVYSVGRLDVDKVSLSFSHLYKRYLVKDKVKFIIGGGLAYAIERDHIESTRSIQDGPDDPFVADGEPRVTNEILFPDLFLTPLVGVGTGRFFLEARAHLGFLNGYSGLSANLGFRVN